MAKKEIKIKLSTQGTKKAERELGGVERSIKTLGKSMFAFAGFAIMAKGLKDMVSAASDTEESLNKVREVFGSAAKSVEKFSSSAATSLGASTQEALAMTGEIGNLLVAFGFAEQGAADMSTKMVQLAADLGSFNNVPTVEALNAIRSALVGESEPIRRFGADVRQTRLDQIALGMGLEFTKGKMDSQTKALAAMEAIMLDTSKAQGDFARTGDQLANASKTLGALTNDLGSDLGEIFLPAVRESVLVLSELVGGVKEFLKAGKEPDDTLGKIEKIRAEIKALDDQIAKRDEKGIGGLFSDADVSFADRIEQSGKNINDLQSERWDLQNKLYTLMLNEKDVAEEIIKVVDRDKQLRDEILAGHKLKIDRQRIYNQLVTEGLIPLSEEQQKLIDINNRYKDRQPIAETLGHLNGEMVESLAEEEWRLGNIQAAQERWTDEARKTREEVFAMVDRLADMYSLLSGERDFTWRDALSVGKTFAKIIMDPSAGYAEGGRPEPNKPAIVGERGPELFIPDRPGTIVPNGGMGNNLTINLNGVFHGSVDELAEEIADRSNQGFNRVAVNA